MNLKLLVVTVGLVACVGIGVFWYSGNLSHKDGSWSATKGSSHSTASISSKTPMEYKLPPFVQKKEAKVFHVEYTESLNSPQGDFRQDLNTLCDTLQAYRTLVKDRNGNPAGNNQEITRTLLGSNIQKMAFIAQDNKAIDSQGRLVDRWGTPYFFHSLSSQIMQIRSAGPDGKFYTDDDGVIGQDPKVEATLRSKYKKS
jgi:hypothetical protein